MRQLALLDGEVEELVAGLREAEEIRRQSPTRYLEDRGAGRPRKAGEPGEPKSRGSRRAGKGRPPEPEGVPGAVRASLVGDSLGGWRL